MLTGEVIIHYLLMKSRNLTHSPYAPSPRVCMNSHPSTKSDLSEALPSSITLLHVFRGQKSRDVRQSHDDKLIIFWRSG